MSFVGKDYLCYSLWDKYIEFEYSHKDWTFHAHVCIQALKFPTRKLHCYYERYLSHLIFFPSSIPHTVEMTLLALHKSNLI